MSVLIKGMEMPITHPMTVIIYPDGTVDGRMKAWLVLDALNADWSTVVFAETRGKAKTIAQNTDALEGVGFTEIRARRLPEADRLYIGAPEIDRAEVEKWTNIPCST